MSQYKKESGFFDATKNQKKCSHKKMGKFLKSIGGRRGLLLASLVLKEPKFKEF
jgi:hypothetical protein